VNLWREGEEGELGGRKLERPAVFISKEYWEIVKEKERKKHGEADTEVKQIQLQTEIVRVRVVSVKYKERECGVVVVGCCHQHH
jgi:hypothetical protein